MKLRSDVPPDTLAVELAEEGIAVEYTDGREVFYHGVPEPVAGSVRTGPDMHVHVLVTDEAGTEGVLTYVNDRTTHDDVLESTGVGRVLVERNEDEELFPGVRVEMDGLAAVVEADPGVVGGRVFVFEEDERRERSYEIVAPDDEAEGDPGGGERDDGPDGSGRGGDPGAGGA